MQIEIPGYRIIKTLGKGGMASVYLAIQESFEREVALKVMSPDLSSDAAFGERFIREAKIVSRLVHPNIVTVYDVGIHEGHYFLSMEYIPGQDLTHKRHELTLLENLQVIKDIARALDFAGRKGYVHRDVKPENIMFHEESGRPVLMDFGIARPSDVASGMTQTGMAIGTPHYMSPEQAKGQAVDARADLYSLGVVLYLLLTGHVPYDADSAVVVGIMHVSEDIPRLPTHLQLFQPIIDKVLAKSPADRYQSGTELIADLDALKMQDINTAAEARLIALVEVAKKNAEKKAQRAMATTITPSGFGSSEGFGPAGFRTPANNKTVLTPHAITPDFIPPAKKSPAKAQPSTIKANINKPLVAGEKRVNETKLSETKIEERLMISAQDRLGHFHTEPEKKSSGGMGIFFVLLLSLGAAGYFYQTEITQFSQQFIAGEAFKRDSTKLTPEPLLPEPLAKAAPPVVAKNEAAVKDNAVKDTEIKEIEIKEKAPTPEEIAEKEKEEREKIAQAEREKAEAEKAAEAAAAEKRLQSEIEQKNKELLAEAERKNKEELAAKKLQEQIQAQERSLLDKAKTQYQAGNLIAPAGDSALDNYRKALNVNAKSKSARDGIALVEKTSVQQIQRLIQDKKFDEASASLKSVQAHFTQSESLLALSVELTQAIADTMPAVTRLSVTSEEVSRLIYPQEPDIAADRVIYIGFEYRNFKSEASVIQATLYDGSRNHQIVQVPVVVNGAEGTKFFRMEQPVSGFAEGGYNIDLELQNQLLISSKFTVSK